MGSGVAVQRTVRRPQDESRQQTKDVVAAPLNSTCDVPAADEDLLRKESDSCSSTSSTSSESCGASKSDELPLVAQWFKQLYEKEKEEKERLQQECKAKDEEISKLRARLGDGVVVLTAESDEKDCPGGLASLGSRHQASRPARPSLQERRSGKLSLTLPAALAAGAKNEELPKSEDDSKLVLPPIGKTTDTSFKTHSFLEGGPSIRQRRMSDPGLSSHVPVSTLNVSTTRVSSLKDEPMGPKRRASFSSPW